jgi:GntR family transcriptional regulator
MISWHHLKIDLRHGTRRKSILAALEAAIRAGHIRAGDRLPPQRLIADFIGVHVNTVNQALRDAAHLGLVSARRGSGTMVIAHSGSSNVAVARDA